MKNSAIISVLLKMLSYSGLTSLWGRNSKATGAIFCLHHVLPGGGQNLGFSPNHQLEISPEFLEQIIRRTKSKGYRFVSMDDLAIELSKTTSSDKLAAITFDDGYRDNALYAAPVLRKHNVPYTIYVTKKIAEGSCELWWRALEQLIAIRSNLELEIEGKHRNFSTASIAEKVSCANTLFPIVKAMDEHEQRRWIRTVCEKYGFGLEKYCRDAAMDWHELRELAKDPLCTIGAHTVNHFALRKLNDADAAFEINESKEAIERELSIGVKHFAYPYGDHAAAGPRDFSLAKAAGFLTSVTTRKGLVFPDHREHMQALPRLMISGRYQSIEMFDVLLSGLPFALLNRFRKVDVS